MGSRAPGLAGYDVVWRERAADVGRDAEDLTPWASEVRVPGHGAPGGR
ncbi:MAG TPA: hypothetical protein PLK46_13410 [Propioniciclava sp.]|nr:hypothetical protein [Propioniciclava sp.]HRL81314.1 hypothetical protein [Propioniciclava sp.]